MKLWKDKPSVYNMSIEDLEKVLEELMDRLEELDTVEEHDNGIRREDYRTLSENTLTYADAVTYHLHACIKTLDRLKRNA